MQPEIQYLDHLYRSAYEGHPWFGRNIVEILGEIDEQTAFQKPNNQHSIVELLYHMIVWREFTISRIEADKARAAGYFEENDWSVLDHEDKSLWRKGLQKLDDTQKHLLEILKNLKEDQLTQKVADRKYDVRHLLYGILEHDIYHLGQIAYIKKLLEGKNVRP
jgi:uncharacterized damage-inducible protein DinB